MNKLIYSLAISTVAYGVAYTQKTTDKPNIIIIYTDDMGIGDVKYSGGKVEQTPNIDRLAAQGKVFTKSGYGSQLIV